MAELFHGLVLLLALLALSIPSSHALRKHNTKNSTKTDVYLSPKFVVEPGSASYKYFYNIDFPKGHIALKSFNAEIVDEQGNPIPLSETYLHHWIVLRYYARKGVVEPKHAVNPEDLNESDFIFVRNAGVCQDDVYGQYYGLGSETRRTATYVPYPYGVEIGDHPENIPDGFEERWALNVHAIDTRGAKDRLECIECRCDAYNVTRNIYAGGQPLPAGYKGGLLCCYDGTKCRVKQGFNGVKRNLYLRYTVKWVHWSHEIVPVKIYIFDATDTMNYTAGPFRATHNCLIEYDVEKSCSANSTSHGCIDNKWAVVTMPTGGHVIYAVAHQHIGGLGATLYGQDGRVLCSSTPIYGKGKEAGNEDGYIVGMSTCYPKPGSVKISDGETLSLVSNYSSTQMHTGLMGLFYILVAETL